MQKRDSLPKLSTGATVEMKNVEDEPIEDVSFSSYGSDIVNDLDQDAQGL